MTKGSKVVGSIAGCVAPSGYVLINIDGRLFRAHRLAWFYVYGEWPVADVDHINRGRADNRIVNLREASRSQNLANKRCDERNKSGSKGVSWDKERGLWAAFIKKDKKSRFLGRYKTKQEASAAYWQAATTLFGQFARAA